MLCGVPSRAQHHDLLMVCASLFHGAGHGAHRAHVVFVIIAIWLGIATSLWVASRVMPRHRCSSRRRAAIGVAALVLGGTGVFVAAPAGAAVPPWTTRLASVGAPTFDAISCPTARVCTAVGTGSGGLGSTYRTIDAGQDWMEQAMPGGTGPLDLVSCPTVEFCLASSDESVPTVAPTAFYSTTTGGQTWNAVSTTTSIASYVTSLDCVTQLVCFAALGRAGQLNVSADGGAHWSVVGSSSNTIASLVCPSTTTCFSTGISPVTGASERAVIDRWQTSSATLRTTYSHSWPGTWGAPEPSISCTTSSNCMAAGFGTGSTVLTTTSGGRTWRVRMMPRGLAPALTVACAPGARCAILFARAGAIDEALTDIGGQGWATRPLAASSLPSSPGELECPVANGCYLAGFGTSTNGLRKQGAGGAWSVPQIASGLPALTAVACATDESCEAIGPGVAISSVDAGTTWSSSSTPPPSNVDLRSIACPTASDCVAAGSVPSGALVVGAIYRTTDGGATWHPAELPSVGAIRGLSCASATVCVAAAGGSTPLLVSTDGGASWTAVALASTPLVRLNSISCGSSSTCVAVGADDSSNVVVTTSDGGATWSVLQGQSVPLLLGVDCSSSTSCVAAGAGGAYGPGIYESVAYATTDVGATWTSVAEVPGSNITSLTCSSTACQAISRIEWGTPASSLAASTDGGTTWAQEDFPPVDADIEGITATPSGTWIAVGSDLSNGALVLTAAS